MPTDMLLWKILTLPSLNNLPVLLWQACDRPRQSFFYDRSCPGNQRKGRILWLGQGRFCIEITKVPVKTWECFQGTLPHLNPLTLEYKLVPPINTEKRKQTQGWYDLIKETFQRSGAELKINLRAGCPFPRELRKMHITFFPELFLPSGSTTPK